MDQPLGHHKIPKTGAVLPLQLDLEQQLGHLQHCGQKSSDQYRKHLSHILISDVEQYLDLSLSFVVIILQYVHDLQQERIHLKFGSVLLSLCNKQVLQSLCSRAGTVYTLEHLHNNCHLYDD